MASKRMFNKSITNSARFIKMPAETQALYFHLCMSADDDGVCEAFSVMRLIGSTEDNIRILHAKGFIKILNDELVSYIVDWNEHNSLRADRKINSIYRELLLQIMPGIELVEPKPRADRLPKNNGTSLGRTWDGLDKYSIDKISIDKNRLVKKSISKLSLEDFIEKIKPVIELKVLEGYREKDLLEQAKICWLHHEEKNGIKIATTAYSNWIQNQIKREKITKPKKGLPVATLDDNNY